MAYISGAFRAHIDKSRKENPFYLGTLHCHNDGLPIRVCANQSPQSPARIAPPPRASSQVVAMIDVSMLAEAAAKQIIETMVVPANQMTIAQQRIVQAIWQIIQLARQEARMSKEELSNLEVRFISLVAELNNAYRKITQDTKGGMQFLYEHLHTIAIQRAISRG